MDKMKWICKYGNNCYRCPLKECEFNKLIFQGEQMKMSDKKRVLLLLITTIIFTLLFGMLLWMDGQ